MKKHVYNKEAFSNAEKKPFKKRKAFDPENYSWLSRSQEIVLRILEELDDQGLSVTDLAGRMNSTKQNISKLLKGTENFGLATIAKFEKALGITLIDVKKKEKNVKEAAQERIRKGFSTMSLIKNENLIIVHTYHWDHENKKEIFLNDNASIRKEFRIPQPLTFSEN